jgi:hypothetical protein
MNFISVKKNRENTGRIVMDKTNRENSYIALGGLGKWGDNTSNQPLIVKLILSHS